MAQEDQKFSSVLTYHFSVVSCDFWWKYCKRFCGGLNWKVSLTYNQAKIGRTEMTDIKQPYFGNFSLEKMSRSSWSSSTEIYLQSVFCLPDCQCVSMSNTLNFRSSIADTYKNQGYRSEPRTLTVKHGFESDKRFRWQHRPTC